MVGFIGRQNNFFSFMIVERFISLGWGWKQEMKRLHECTSGERKCSSLRSENHRNILPSKVRQLLP